MKSLALLIALFSISNIFSASQCTGRFTPFEMLNVGVDKEWITLRSVTETRQCESVYGKIRCKQWQVASYAKPFIGKLTLKLVSQDKTVFTRGTHYRKTSGTFDWQKKKTILSLRVTKSVSVRGSCRQWGASGGVGYGGCRSYNTVSKDVFVGRFKGRVSEVCADLTGPVTKSEATYFSQDTFAYTETRKILRN